MHQNNKTMAVKLILITLWRNKRKPNQRIFPNQAYLKQAKTHPTPDRDMQELSCSGDKDNHEVEASVEKVVEMVDTQMLLVLQDKLHLTVKLKPLMTYLWKRLYI